MKRKYRSSLAVFMLLILFVLSACTVQEAGVAATEPTEPAAPISSSGVKVHFIDVGQGDCTLIQLPDGRNIIIDGGNRADFSVITQYLKHQNVKTIDFLIATHPHEDHIGSLPDIVKDYQIGSIYMPKASANTRIYEELLLAIKRKNYKINTAAAGVRIIDDKDLKLVLLAPNAKEYDELNNYSAVAKLSYKNTSFLFTGDAEDISENEMIKNSEEMKADVIKIGHHGGRTSSTSKFLSMVSPKSAVISVGKDNDYGHPHPETMKRLNALKIQVYRTDLLGTIIMSTDGNTIATDKAAMATTTENKQVGNSYIGNINSKIYHLNSCSSLPKTENQIKLKSKMEAQQAGFKPCQVCKP